MKMARRAILLNLLLLALITQPATSRTIASVGPRSQSALDLLTRLNLLDDPDAPSCWDAMFQLQACTEEVVTFFLNGETHLGHGCCQAIRTIEHHCWPGLMWTLGFTREEGEILGGYCAAVIEPDG